MKLAVILTATYLLGAVITYGIVADWNEIRDAAAEGARAARPNASDRLIQHAVNVAARRVALRVAIVWPLVVLAMLITVPLSYRRNNTRK